MLVFAALSLASCTGHNPSGGTETKTHEAISSQLESWDKSLKEQYSIFSSLASLSQFEQCKMQALSKTLARFAAKGSDAITPVPTIEFAFLSGNEAGLTYLAIEADDTLPIIRRIIVREFRHNGTLIEEEYLLPALYTNEMETLANMRIVAAYAFPFRWRTDSADRESGRIWLEATAHNTPKWYELPSIPIGRPDESVVFISIVDDQSNESPVYRLVCVDEEHLD